MYIATAYIGDEWTPGEILPDDLPEELTRRLLRAGAIREDAPAPVSPAAVRRTRKTPEKEPEPEEEPEEEPEAPEIDVTAALVKEPKAGGRKGAGKK